MNDIILIGGGGHCNSVIDSLKDSTELNIVGILDLKNKIGTLNNGVKIIGEDNDLKYYFKQGIKNAFVTAGGIGDNSLRIKLFNLAKEIGYKIPAIIDKNAIVSDTALIGDGTFIGKGAIINTSVIVGENCIINSGAIIDHDCRVSDFCHIAPGTTLSGGVYIDKKSHIGTNSTVIQNIRIGMNTIIGAGSVVVKDIGSKKKAYGNPCKVV